MHEPMSIPTLPATGVVDLTPDRLHERIESDRQAAEQLGAACELLQRVERRVSHLEAKHARLPIGNAKRKTAKALGELRSQRRALREAIG